MIAIFLNCSSLTTLPDISKWNTDKVKNMIILFFNCSSLISLPDISIWNIHNVTNISYMFTKCISLVSLPDLSKWGRGYRKEMYSLFKECVSLTTIPNIINWRYINWKQICENPDYDAINKYVNLKVDAFLFINSQEDYNIFNNNEFLRNQRLDKYKLIYEG